MVGQPAQKEVADISKRKWLTFKKEKQVGWHKKEVAQISKRIMANFSERKVSWYAQMSEGNKGKKNKKGYVKNCEKYPINTEKYTENKQNK